MAWPLMRPTLKSPYVVTTVDDLAARSHRSGAFQ
jgi:hypothetical protein